jgi:diaminopimelate epimerase
VSGALTVTKMSGAGNDFVVLEASEAAKLGRGLRAWVRSICRRGLSIGADGVLVLSREGPDRVRMSFHNPDGSEAFCGNGSRCAARYAALAGWSGGKLRLLTSIGEIPAEVSGDLVRVTVPAPTVLGSDRFEVDGEKLDGVRVDAGCPHVVLAVPDAARVPIERLAPPIRRDPRFGAEGTNVDFVSWAPGGDLLLRTWERGVEGETLSCGTGALAAAAVAGRERGLDVVRVIPRGGVPLLVRIEGGRFVLEGDARVVFRGEVTAEATAGLEET